MNECFQKNRGLWSATYCLKRDHNYLFLKVILAWIATQNQLLYWSFRKDVSVINFVCPLNFHCIKLIFQLWGRITLNVTENIILLLFWCFLQMIQICNNPHSALMIHTIMLYHSHKKQIVWKLGPNGPFYALMLRTKLY